MPVDTRTTTQKYGITITTVDPSTNTIQGVLKTAGAAHITVVTTPIAFRWPIVGESWMVRQENGAWYLDSPWPSLSVIESVPVGDVVLNSPTGVVHVNGSSDGFTDFTFTGGFVVGDLKVSAIAGAQNGWLLCEGQAVSRTTYANLFAAIGTTYGAGDGHTTFNLPTLTFGSGHYLIKY